MTGAASAPDPSTSPGDLVVGIDVGGTKTLAALVELPAGPPAGRPAGPPRVVRTALVPSSADSADAVAVLADAARTAMEGAAAPVRAVGVGLAGFVDLGGVVRTAPNAPGLVDLDVAGVLQAELGLPVRVDNDANCAAVAAHALLAPDAAHLVAVTLGTGIGGGFIVDGELLRGAHGFAGEPGHMVIERDGPPCPCGQRGCWERFASGSGLARLARLAVEQGRAPAVAARAGSAEAVRGEHVTDLVAAGDPGARAVFEEFAGYVALGLANLILLTDPQVVVLGGGLIAEGDRLLDLVRAELARSFPAAAGRDVRLAAAPGGPEAGALGAALVAARERSG